MTRSHIITVLTLWMVLQSPSVAKAEESVQPAISQEEAEKIALQQVDGTIIDSELEQEHGRWQYAIDIRKDGKTYDVEIHADTGEVIQVQLDK